MHRALGGACPAPFHAPRAFWEPEGAQETRTVQGAMGAACPAPFQVPRPLWEPKGAQETRTVQGALGGGARRGATPCTVPGSQSILANRWGS